MTEEEKPYWNACPKPIPQAKKPKVGIRKQSKKMVTLRQKINAAKNKVRERDGMVCTSCFEKEGFIDCSHIISENDCKKLNREELAYDTDNMVCQCRRCHRRWEDMDMEHVIWFNNWVAIAGFVRANHPQRYERMCQKLEEVIPE